MATASSNGPTGQVKRPPTKPRTVRFKKLGAWFSTNATKLRVWLATIPGKCRAWLSRVWKTISEFFVGAEREEARCIVSGSWWKALGKCTVHCLPVAATITVAYLNLAGYFIGMGFTGLGSPSAQAVDRLCLQVTAKLFELFIIASLGVVVLDAIRDKLLFGSEGVPLGLVLAKDRFGDLSYLFSREFRAGLFGFGRLQTRVLFAILILTCALIALFAGPSAALLLIPSWYSAWPAGGASFWINGDLFPTTFDTTASSCSTWEDNSTFVNSANFSAVSCPWAGYPDLLNAFTQQAFTPESSLTYQVGPLQQNIQFSWDGPSPNLLRHYAVGSNIAIAAFSRYIGWNVWHNAIYDAPQVQKGRLLYNLKYRVYNSTKGSVKSKLPVVRSQCYQADQYTASEDMIASTPRGQVLLPFPLIPDFSGNVDMRYFLPVTLLNTTQLATQWIPIPSGPSNNSFGPPSSHYPSAFLVIQNPGIPGSNSTITCSIQANWISGYNVATGIAWGWIQTNHEQGALGNQDTNTLVGKWLSERNFSSGDNTNLPGTWEHITLTTHWLHSLTPILNTTIPGSTTLASVLQAAATSSLSPFLAPVLDPLYQTLNSFFLVNAIIGSFIVDGMSRIGWEENNLDYLNWQYVFYNDTPPYDFCYWNWNSHSWTQIYQQIMAGKATMLPCSLHPASGEGEMYQWTASVEGYGILADSVAYYLALSVLFTHSLLALMHTVWTLIRRRTSFAWTSTTDLLAFGLSSTPPEDKLKDASSGIDANTTLKLQLRIRDVQPVPVGREQVQLLLDDESGKKIVEGEEYGAQT